MPEMLSPRSCEKYAALPVLGAVVSEFAGWLLKSGFARTSVRSHLRATVALERDLRRAGVRDASMISRKALEECARWNSQDARVLATIRSLARFLGEQGTLSESHGVLNFKEAILADYAAYLTDVRGLVATTVSGHRGTASRLLAGLGHDELAFRLSTLGPPEIEAFVRSAGEHYGRDTLSHVVANLRSFLRFLSIRGLAPSRLDRIVDSPRTYRREHLPRSLPWETVRGLLQSVDQSSAKGVRDYAKRLLIWDQGSLTRARHDSGIAGE
jgi:hypothetical protein